MLDVCIRCSLCGEDLQNHGALSPRTSSVTAELGGSYLSSQHLGGKGRGMTMNLEPTLGYIEVLGPPGL